MADFSVRPGAPVMRDGESLPGTIGMVFEGRHGWYGVTAAHVFIENRPPNLVTDVVLWRRHRTGSRTRVARREMPAIGGYLQQIEPLMKPGAGHEWRHDAALVRLGAIARPASRWNLVRIPHGITTRQSVGDRTVVWKVGHTTGVSFGVIESWSTSVVYPDESSATDLIRIRPARPYSVFSADGDSGAIIMDLGRRPVAMVLGGGADESGAFSIGMPFSRVVTALGLGTVPR